MPDADNDLENRSFVIGRPNKMHLRLDTFDFYLLDVGRGERDTAFPFHAKLHNCMGTINPLIQQFHSKDGLRSQHLSSTYLRRSPLASHRHRRSCRNLER